jgi:pyruvate dehydrogenase E1 component beta subunit
MPIDVRLPDLGDSVTHAKLTAWLKREGDSIQAGELIAEVETDKTNIEIEAPGSGTLVRIHVVEGTEGIAIDTLLAVIAGRAGGGDAGNARGR